MRYLTTIPLKLKTSSGLLELKPGDTFKPKSDEATKGLLANGKIKPVRDVISQEYESLTDWLHQHDLTGDEIKETLPKLYSDIQDSIERLDTAFVAEDLRDFRDMLARIKQLYTEAMLKCGRSHESKE